VEAREQQTLAEQKRQARETGLKRRSNTALRILVVVLLIATVGAFILTSLAVNQSQIADNNAGYARSIALAAAAKSAQLSNNPDPAIALAAAANTTVTQPPALAQSVLYQTAFVPSTRRLFTTEPTYVESPSPDGHKVLSSSDKNLLAYWNLDTQE